MNIDIGTFSNWLTLLNRREVLIGGLLELPEKGLRLNRLRQKVGFVRKVENGRPPGLVLEGRGWLQTQGPVQFFLALLDPPLVELCHKEALLQVLVRRRVLTREVRNLGLENPGEERFYLRQGLAGRLTQEPVVDIADFLGVSIVGLQLPG